MHVYKGYQALMIDSVNGRYANFKLVSVVG